MFPEDRNLGLVQEQDTVSIHMGGGVAHTQGGLTSRAPAFSSDNNAFSFHPGP